MMEKRGSGVGQKKRKILLYREMKMNKKKRRLLIIRKQGCGDNTQNQEKNKEIIFLYTVRSHPC